MRHSFSLFVALLALAPFVFGTLVYQEGTEYVYQVDGTLNAGRKLSDPHQAATEMTAVFAMQCQGMVSGKIPNSNEQVYQFVANMFDTTVSDNDPNGNTEKKFKVSDDTPLGSDIYFFQRVTGQVVEIDYDEDDSPYYTQVKIGVINALHTMIPATVSPTPVLFKDEDAVGVHNTAVQSSNSAQNYVQVSKKFDQSDFFSFSDPNLKKNNVILSATGVISIHPSGYLFSSNSVQAVDLVSVSQSSAPSSVSSNSPVDFNVHSNGNLKINFMNVQTSEKLTGKKAKGTHRKTGSLSSIALESQVAVAKVKVSSSDAAKTVESVFEAKSSQVQTIKITKSLHKLVKYFRANPSTLSVLLKRVLAEVQSSPKEYQINRLFFILSSVSNAESENLLITFGLKSSSVLVQERALFALNFVKNPSENLIQTLEKIYLEREKKGQDTSSHILAIGSLASRSSSPLSHKSLIVSAAVNALAKSNTKKVMQSLYAIGNAGSKVVSLSEFQRIPFKSYSDSRIKLTSQRLAHEIYGIKLKDSDYPYNRSKSVDYTLGGSTISSQFTANAFVGTNFDCNHQSFNFEAEADAEVSLSLFGQSQQVVKAEAIYGQANGSPLSDDAYLYVWGKIVKQYNFPQLNCQAQTIPIAEYAPGFDYEYTVWVSIIPITFDAAADLDLSLAWSYDICPAQLEASVSLLPNAKIVISGSANIDLLIIKAGAELDGSFDSTIVPTAYVQGSQCTVGYKVVMTNEPMTISFLGYYQKKECKILWIWDCSLGPKEEFNWYTWSLPATTKTLVQKDYKISQ
eukprot:TRINITY_DN1149_c0_g1_i1.p1 TRINITY_DN1149_c0_g1~~TRINITY_DN1149_c0_g1_i1.p1  ORF type:complete len:810 (+),score=303.26 TRINITY_DN1149_c0_g1_i1:43-2430(+)